MFAFLRRLSFSFVAVLLVGGLATPVTAQFVNRIAAQPDLKAQKQLSGHVPAWAHASALAAKSVDLSAPLHLFVFLQRDPAAQAAFNQLTADQQNPASPLYHQWLTAQQIGERFGPTADDIAAVSSWLSGQGLTVLPLGPTRTSIAVTGTTATVTNAFHTNFGYYNVDGIARFSTSTEPTIPASLSPVVASIGGLTEEMLMPQHTKKLVNRQDHALSKAGGVAPNLQPEFTNGTDHFVTPGDFAVIYDINPLYTAGNTGATVGAAIQHIAILGRSQVSLSDINTFASFSGIASYKLNPIIASPGVDPGISNIDDQGEATLDVDRVIGTANGAQADLVLASTASGGITAGINYNINVLFDPIMTISFGACEASVGSAGVLQYDALFQTATAEGISTFVSSGDSGVAGCNTSFVNPVAPIIAGINYLCSSTYVTCVGGTQFSDGAGSWSTANGTGHVSAQGYIPEGAWNEPSSNGETTSGFWFSASGGGPSLYIAKPTWQAGITPTDGMRDTPDVSFSAAGHDGYYGCLDNSFQPPGSGKSCAAGDFVAFAGTSGAAPGMAGIAALLNTKLGARQGNLNPLLYRVYGTTPASFHDATPSTASDPCVIGTASTCNNSTPGISGPTGGLAGFPLVIGYDEVTGLGSLDVSAFASAAAGIVLTPAFTITPTSLSLTLAAGTITGNTDSIKITSTNSFAGSVALTCAVVNATGSANGTCSVAPTPVTLAAGSTATSTLTILPAAATSGTMNVVVTGTNASTVVTSSILVTVNLPSTFTLTTASPALTLTAGSTGSNTDVVTVTSFSGFAGSVSLSCTIAINSGTATVPPTCAMSPVSVSLPSNGTITSTATIGSQAASSGCTTQNIVPALPWKLSGGVFAAFALILIPLRKRRSFRSLLALGCLGLGLSLVSGCSSGTGGTGTPCATHVTAPTTAGVYTATVTGISGNTTVTKTFAVTIQ